jgi:hypothetical protein
MTPQNETRRAGGAAGLRECSLPDSENSPENTKPSPAAQETVSALQRDFAAEALTVVSVYSRHGADCLAFDDEAGAERAIGIAVTHLKEGARAFREWQALKAAVAAPIRAEAMLP